MNEEKRKTNNPELGWIVWKLDYLHRAYREYSACNAGTTETA